MVCLNGLQSAPRRTPLWRAQWLGIAVPMLAAFLSLIQAAWMSLPASASTPAETETLNEASIVPPEGLRYLSGGFLRGPRAFFTFRKACAVSQSLNSPANTPGPWGEQRSLKTTFLFKKKKAKWINGFSFCNSLGNLRIKIASSPTPRLPGDS